MGNFLDSPITDKESHRAEARDMRYGVSAMQGWRVDMEDSHTLCPSMPGEPEMAFFAVYDGHGGSLVARYSAEHMVEEITRAPEWSEQKTPESLGRALVTAHLAMDDSLRKLPQVASGEDRSGCTAISAIVTAGHTIVSNTGDSRSVLARGGATVAMSEDHKPFDPVEQARIEAAGGCVQMRRVNGDLAVSRALGDFDYKRRTDLPAQAQQVSAEPEIRAEARSPDDEFLILACDGIWDVMSNEDATEFVRGVLADGERQPDLIAEEMIDVCLERGSRDNMSALIVLFPGARIGEGSGVAGRRAQRAQAAAAAQGAGGAR